MTCFAPGLSTTKVSMVWTSHCVSLHETRHVQHTQDPRQVMHRKYNSMYVQRRNRPFLLDRVPCRFPSMPTATPTFGFDVSRNPSLARGQTWSRIRRGAVYRHMFCRSDLLACEFKRRRAQIMTFEHRRIQIRD